MKAPRFLVTALLVSAAAFSLSCGEHTPFGVSPQQDLVGAGTETVSKTVESLTLLRCDPLPDVKVSQTVGPEGGVIQIGPHTLSIPAGALSENVKIKAEAPSDTVNHVHFEPEGLWFNKSASLTMSYANCGLVPSLPPRKIVYTTDALVILEVLKSFDLPMQQTVTGRLEHFSDYAVAW